MARKKPAKADKGQQESPKTYNTARPRLKADAEPMPNGHAEKGGAAPRGRIDPVFPLDPLKMSGLDAGPDRRITAAELTQREHEWWEKGFIPRDLLTLCVGDSDAGKSTFLAHLAAAWTNGKNQPRSFDYPVGRVMVFGSEEDAGGTIRPRLEAHGADLSRVVFGEIGPGGRPLPRLLLPDDLAKLDRLIHDYRISLLIIDPITAHLSGGVDQNKDQSVRQLLAGLSDVGANNGCTIMATKHYRKGKEGSPLDWIGGAAAWHQVPRVILAFGCDPDDRTKRVMAVSKNSLMPRPRSKRFEISGPERRGVFRELGECDLTAEDIGSASLNPADRDALGDAQSFLIDALTTEEKPAKDVVRVAQESGIALGTLRRAKAKLGVTSHPIGPNGQRFIVWRMPAQEAPQKPPVGA